MRRNRHGASLPWSGTRTASASRASTWAGVGPGSASRRDGTERRRRRKSRSVMDRRLPFDPSDAPLEQKAAACRGLARFGDKDCVPVLAGMLGDEKLAHMARHALEPIPDKSADEALRAALDRLDGKLLVGAIGSIGVRRDPAAVESLGKHLGSSVGDVVRTTAIALGHIETAAAGKTLLEGLKNATGDNVSWIGDGLLTCGANLAAAGRQGEAKELYDGMLARNPPVRIRAAALRGLVLCDRSNSAKLLTGMLHDRELGVFAMALRVAADGLKQRV